MTMNGPEPTTSPSQPPTPGPRLVLRAAGIVLARGRFLLVVGGLLTLIAVWPYLQNQWDKLTEARSHTGRSPPIPSIGVRCAPASFPTGPASARSAT